LTADTEGFIMTDCNVTTDSRQALREIHFTDNQFACIPAVVLRKLPTLSGNAVKLAVILGSFMNREGACWPSVQTLLERAGWKDRRSCRRLIAELIGAGVVVVERRNGRTTVYKWGRVENARGDGSNPPTRCVTDPPPGAFLPPQNNTNNNTTNTTGGGDVVERSTKKVGGSDDVWNLWTDININADRAKPPRIKSELNAAADLARLIQNGDLDMSDLSDCMRQFVDDEDPWLKANGKSLRWLPQRLNKYLNRDIDAGYGVPPLDVLEQIESTVLGEST